MSLWKVGEMAVSGMTMSDCEIDHEMIVQEKVHTGMSVREKSRSGAD